MMKAIGTERELKETVEHELQLTVITHDEKMC